MGRGILAVLGGLVAWVVIVTFINFGLRFSMAGYQAAEPGMAFTLPMLIARLVMAAVTSLAAGAIVRAISPASRLAPWIVGLMLLVLFVPLHVQIWPAFPAWYHLAFLFPLAPLVVIGARIGRRR